MWHIVYLTRNLINDKIYVGVHSTWNLNDGYLGSGGVISRAIKKYGRENFERTILHFCHSQQHSLELESVIVDVQFLNRPDVYNIQPGGNNQSYHTGMKHTNESKQRISESRKSTTGVKRGPYRSDCKLHEPRSAEHKAKTSETLKRKYESGEIDKSYMRKPKSEEHKEKIRQSMLRRRQ